MVYLDKKIGKNRKNSRSDRYNAELYNTKIRRM